MTDPAKPTVFISVPILGNPELAMMNSVYAQMGGCGTRCYLHFQQQESLIQRARNNAMATFLDRGEESHLLTWDSDIECVGTTSGANAIRRLLDAGKDIVGGLYALKAGVDGKLASQPLEHPVVLDGGLIKMRWLSTGFMMISRQAAEKMVAQYPDQMYVADGDMSGKEVCGLYNPYIVRDKDGKGKLLSEDWAICQRWLDMGGEIWADTSIVLNHYGKRAYKLWTAKP
jgi:hypothetical protein